ncbi:hypothetical protein T440DRAFT_83864 [Plenodomus tracheiphilus IPT5]|uniref:Uncharacterized protein n=1 Tax=Plenodomus tracheiphilus IPT5 TaxID=1408161 RepID=A0A6A7B5Y6_9PLEO|nr:hypothetical protein T440DRAFT_83864 [Plenodomus tracheiphilus IPT5]
MDLRLAYGLWVLLYHCIVTAFGHCSISRRPRMEADSHPECQNIFRIITKSYPHLGVRPSEFPYTCNQHQLIPLEWDTTHYSMSREANTAKTFRTVTAMQMLPHAHTFFDPQTIVHTKHQQRHPCALIELTLAFG